MNLHKRDAPQLTFNIKSAISYLTGTDGAKDDPGKDSIPHFLIYFVIAIVTGTHSSTVQLFTVYGLFPSIEPSWASQLEVPDGQRPPIA